MSKFKFWHSVSEEPMLGLGIIVCNKELDLWEASYIGGGRIQLASKYGTLPDNIFKLSLFEGWGVSCISPWMPTTCLTKNPAQAEHEEGYVCNAPQLRPESFHLRIDGFC